MSERLIDYPSLVVPLAAYFIPATVARLPAPCGQTRFNRRSGSLAEAKNAGGSKNLPATSPGTPKERRAPTARALRNHARCLYNIFASETTSCVLTRFHTCRSGGIGRRAWFRSMYPQGCGGSSPFFGTRLLIDPVLTGFPRHSLSDESHFWGGPDAPFSRSVMLPKSTLSSMTKNIPPRPFWLLAQFVPERAPC